MRLASAPHPWRHVVVRRWILCAAFLIACGDDDTESDAGLDAARDVGVDVTVDVAADAALPDMLGPADRPARVFVPDSLDDPGLILLLHGYGPGDESFAFLLSLAQSLADAGYVAVVPPGSEDSRGYQFWNANPVCCDLDGSGVDDVAYLRGLILEAEEHFPIDVTRVFLFGHSNGAFMSYRMACDATDLVRGIVTLAGTEDPATLCTPSANVHVLHIHGDADDVALYGGGPSPLNGRMIAGAEETAARWAALNGCDPTPTDGPRFDHERDIPGAETTSRTWSGCTASSVGLWTIEGGSHVPRFGEAFFTDIAAWYTAR